MIIKNLTPHAIVLRSTNGIDTIIPPEPGTVARVASSPGMQLGSEGFPCLLYSSPTWGEVVNLPEPQEGVIFIVSSLVAGRVCNRPDVFSPGTGPTDGAIREPDKLGDGTPNPKKGQIMAVTRLIQTATVS